MSPLVKKEIRLLLPAWTVAMLLAIFSLPNPVWANWFTNAPNIGVPLAFVLGFLFLGIQSFGQEFSSGTFAALLAQPMERHRICRVKMSILALAFVSVLFVWAVPREFYSVTRIQENLPWDFPLDLEKHLLLFALTIFSGALWTTLRLRQFLAAFWLTLLVPVAFDFLVGLISYHYNWTGGIADRVTDGVLIAYSIAGFFWARRMFLGAQDTQWTGGNVFFSWRGKISETASASLSSGPRHWLFSLVWKEIQLHQVNILIAVILLVMDLASFFALKIHPHFKNASLQVACEIIWVFWLLMPLLIGSATVAEERRMGVLESQLCLPVSRRTQLFVKFCTALLLSLFLGGLMPLLLKVDADLNGWIFAVAAAIFFISFYASTLARTVLQAIGLAIVIAVIQVYLIVNALGVLGQAHSNAVGLVLLRLYLGVPVLVLVFAGMAIWNFKWLHQYGKCFRRNAVAVVCAFLFIFILSNSIYFRAWEFLSPTQLPRGPARLDNSSVVKLSVSLNTLYARLPDGRVWIETLAMDFVSNRWQEADILVPSRSHAQFIDGSNWIAIAADSFQALGIKSNSTLWNLQRKWNPSQNRWFQTNSFTVTQIGSDVNWSQAANGGMGFLLTKKDGSLWLWGTHDYDWRNSSNSIPHKLKLDLAMPPARLGSETDWTTLFPAASAYSPRAMKNDGTIWHWIGWSGTNHSYALTLETNLNGPWSSLVHLEDFSVVGIKTNGGLWVIRTIESGANRNRKERQVEEQIGKVSRWKSVAGGWNGIYAIRDDGTLWKWSPNWNLSNSSEPVQLGNQSNWITPDTYWPGTFSVAADGSLWAWDQPSRYIWLAPSRKPLYLGNIFQGAASKTYEPAD